MKKHKQRLSIQIRHLKAMLYLHKHWDYFTKDSWGYCANKVQLHEMGLITKPTLEQHIQRTRYNIRRTLSGSGKRRLK